jgi:hypothetical protein
VLFADYLAMAREQLPADAPTVTPAWCRQVTGCSAGTSVRLAAELNAGRPTRSDTPPAGHPAAGPTVPAAHADTATSGGDPGGEVASFTASTTNPPDQGESEAA